MSFHEGIYDNAIKYNEATVKTATFFKPYFIASLINCVASTKKPSHRSQQLRRT
jgi:hypothetical protein